MDEKPATPQSYAPPQAIQAGVGIFVVFVAGIFASRGLISKETMAYLGSPETLGIISTLIAAVIGAWRAYANSPHRLIQNTAALSQVNAVITKPKTADEISSINVVGSVSEASRLPGVN